MPVYLVMAFALTCKPKRYLSDLLWYHATTRQKNEQAQM